MKLLIMDTSKCHFQGGSFEAEFQNIDSMYNAVFTYAEPAG